MLAADKNRTVEEAYQVLTDALKARRPLMDDLEKSRILVTALLDIKRATAQLACSHDLRSAVTV